METFKRLLPELKLSEGKFALIQGDRLLDIFGTYEDAIKRGYADFGTKPFLVKRIDSFEEIHSITRAVLPARA